MMQKANIHGSPASHILQSGTDGSQSASIEGSDYAVIVQIIGDVALKDWEQIRDDVERRQQLAEKLGMSEKAVLSFFSQIDKNEVPLAEWPEKFAEIAQLYRSQQERLDRYDGKDAQLVEIRLATKTALDALDWPTAEKLWLEAAARQREINDEAEELLRDGKLAEAEDYVGAAESAAGDFEYQRAAQHYLEAARILERWDAEVTRGRYLNQAGIRFLDAGKYEAGVQAMLPPLEITKVALGEEHPSYATTLNNLAGLYFHTERYAESAAYMEQALSILEATLPAAHPNIEMLQEGLTIIRSRIPTE